MARLATKKTVRLDLGDNEWIDFRKSLSFEEIEPFLRSIEGEKQSDPRVLLPLLEVAITSWCILGDDDQEVAYSKELIAKLDTDAFVQMAQFVQNQYFPQKKTSPESIESSSTTAPENPGDTMS